MSGTEPQRPEAASDGAGVADGATGAAEATAEPAPTPRARFGPPGSPARRVRHSTIGQVAARSLRFGAATGRPLAVRRAIGVPASVRAGGEGLATVRAPRWWRRRAAEVAGAQAGAGGDAAVTSDGVGPSGAERAPSGAGAAHDVRPDAPLPAPLDAPLDAPLPAPLPARGLRRVVRSVPTEESHAPGSLSVSAAPRTLPMRLPAEVTAAGAMLTSIDRRRRTAAPPPRAREGGGGQAGSPGKASGAGSTPDLSRRGTSAGTPQAATRSRTEGSAADRRGTAGSPAGSRPQAAGTGRARAGAGASAGGSGAAPAPGAPGHATPSSRYVRRRLAAARAAADLGAGRAAAPTTAAGVPLRLSLVGAEPARAAVVRDGLPSSEVRRAAASAAEASPAPARAAGADVPGAGAARQVAGAEAGPVVLPDDGPHAGLPVRRRPMLPMSLPEPLAPSVPGRPGSSTDGAGVRPLRRALGAPVRFRPAAAGSVATPAGRGRVRSAATAGAPSTLATRAVATDERPSAGRVAPVVSAVPTAPTAPSPAASTPAPVAASPMVRPQRPAAQDVAAPGPARHGLGAAAVEGGARQPTSVQRTAGAQTEAPHAVAPAAGAPSQGAHAAAAQSPAAQSLGAQPVAQPAAAQLTAAPPAVAQPVAPRPAAGEPAAAGLLAPAAAAAQSAAAQPHDAHHAAPEHRARTAPSVRRYSGLPVAVDRLGVGRPADEQLATAAASSGRAVRHGAALAAGAVLAAGAAQSRARADAAREVRAASVPTTPRGTRSGRTSTAVLRSSVLPDAPVVRRAHPAPGGHTWSLGIVGPDGPGATSGLGVPVGGSGGPGRAAGPRPGPAAPTFREVVTGGHRAPGSPTRRHGEVRRTPRAAGPGSGAAGLVPVGTPAAAGGSSSGATTRFGLQRSAVVPVELAGVASGFVVLPPRSGGAATRRNAPTDSSAGVTSGLHAAAGPVPPASAGSLRRSTPDGGGSRAGSPAGSAPARLAALVAAEAAGAFGTGSLSSTGWAAPGAAAFSTTGPGGLVVGGPGAPGVPATGSPVSVQRTLEGAVMSPPASADPVSRSWSAPEDPSQHVLAPEVMDQLVDRVVERLEDRVVEELERRGRRRMPGVF